MDAIFNYPFTSFDLGDAAVQVFQDQFLQASYREDQFLQAPYREDQFLQYPQEQIYGANFIPPAAPAIQGDNVWVPAAQGQTQTRRRGRILNRRNAALAVGALKLCLFLNGVCC